MVSRRLHAFHGRGEDGARFAKSSSVPVRRRATSTAVLTTMKRIRLLVTMSLLLFAITTPPALGEPYWIDGYWEQMLDENGNVVYETWIEGRWEGTDDYTWVEGYWVEDVEDGVVVGHYWIEGHWEPKT